MSGFEIRPMSREEMDFAVGLAAKEGWNPGLRDADVFYRTDPEGFLMGLLDGRPVGCVSAVKYGPDFGFIGFYIVVPEERGHVYGPRLGFAAMERLAGRNIGIDGVLDKQENYAKFGFKKAHQNIRHEWIPDSSLACCGSLVEVSSLAFEDVLDYDRAFFPADRGVFLRAWLTMPCSKALAWVERGRMRGYGVVRRCVSGHKVGPLFADSPGVADGILAGLAGFAGKGGPVFLDVPGANPPAMELAARRGMRKVFETARMYSGEAPGLAWGRTFGITSFELG